MPIDWAAFGVDLHLDVDLARGRRAGIEHALREAIRGGRLAPQTRLPSTRALAAELRLARNTVAAAYNQLIAEGYIVARTGSGTTVVGVPQLPQSVTPRTGPPPPRYDLRAGNPDVATFPVEAWLRAGRQALADAPRSVYDYGDPSGRAELRTALVEYLGRTRGVLATPEQIVITSGYVQALSLLAKVLGGPIAMEDPNLPFHRGVVGHAGAEVTPIPVDERGARTDLLENRPAPSAVVLTPSHQYPTGVPLHPTRRRIAVDWARASGGLLIEDDYDGEFRYDREPVGALQGMAPDQTVYVGTTAKTLGPALRLGWMVLPERLIDPIVHAKRHSDRQTESIGQLTLARLITSHVYDRHIRTSRQYYRRRRDLLVERLGRTHPVTGIAAGLHAFIPLPSTGPSEEEILARAAARGLALNGLGPHWHTTGPARGLIVGYATPDRTSYPFALDTLAGVLHS